MTKPLFEAFRLAMLNSPEGSRKEIQDSFMAEMKSDPSYLELLALDYFERMAAVWIVKKERLGNTFTRTEVSQGKIERQKATIASKASDAISAPVARMTPEQLAELRKQSAKRTETAFKELKAKVRAVVLLDLELPNGKKLRQATGAECKKAGGFYSEVAKHLKPTQVVDRHLTESELKNIRARFFQANAQ